MADENEINEYIFSVGGGLLIGISTTLMFLFSGRKEIITEHLFELWTKDISIFKHNKNIGMNKIYISSYNL